MYYNANHIGYGKERDLQMNKKNNNDPRTDTIEKITQMLDKINDEALLNRIYRFVKYIYIHRA